MNENLQLFIESNKDKIIVRRNSEGNIIGIDSLVPTDELNFYRTNCKIDRNTLITADGAQFRFAVKKDDNSMLNDLLKSRVFRRINIKPKAMVSGAAAYIKSIPSKVKELRAEKPKEPIKHAPNPLGNYSELKSAAENLITKLDAIIEKYSKDPRYMADGEFVYYKIKYRDLKARYAKAIQMQDTSEMLNVKTKLVSLSGRIIAKEKQIENPDKPKETKKQEESTAETTPKQTDKEKIVYQDENTVITKPVENKPVNNVEVKVEEPVVTPKLPAQSGIETKVETPKVDIPKTDTAPSKEEPVVEKIEEVSEIERDEERKRQINSDIEKSNTKISNIEENIKYFEDRVKQTEELIKTSNLDSMEINSYNKVKENYQEKLNNQKALLEQAKEELKQNVSKLAAFMQEEVTYYVDGKPYKKVTRAELEKYKQQHISDEKRKEDFIRQKELLEERKELERKLKENYEALKSLSTFEDEMLLPKEEPSIEEIQETVRRFHQ